MGGFTQFYEITIARYTLWGKGIWEFFSLESHGADNIHYTHTHNLSDDHTQASKDKAIACLRSSSSSFSFSSERAPTFLNRSSSSFSSSRPAGQVSASPEVNIFLSCVKFGKSQISKITKDLCLFRLFSHYNLLTVTNLISSSIVMSSFFL